MWQILNNSSSPHNLVESYTWKYGTITISDHEPIEQILKPDQNTKFIITTHPFSNLNLPSNKYIINSTEDNKTIETVSDVCQEMLAKGINRDSHVVVMGGGLTLDLGGFAAAIYMRGVKKVVYVPTTLLAVVDATVGGKTGVNWGGAKNMLGITRHPHEIRISLHYLQSLTNRQFSNGLSQILKMSLTHNKTLFNILQKQSTTIQKLRQNKQILRQIIKTSLQIKMKVVENDQYDRNQRQWLNFGHTVGHALEMSNVGKTFMHGQCVAVGVVEEIKIGGRVGGLGRDVIERIQSVFRKYNLPTKLPQNTNISQLISLMSKDKKNSSTSSITLTLISQIGQRNTQPTQIPIQTLISHYSKHLQISLPPSSSESSTSASLQHKIQKTNKRWSQQNLFPSSKSLSIRYLFLSALSFLLNKDVVTIKNFLESQDTMCMLDCLRAVGFNVQVDLKKKEAVICGYQKKDQGMMNVGNSGLTARFIVPLCAHLPGTWTINCHPRMSQRPNSQIFTFTTSTYNCTFTHLSGIPNTFPVILTSKGLKGESFKKPIKIDSQQSSQFISSVLLNVYLWRKKNIVLQLPKGKLVSESFVQMTVGCLGDFGVQVYRAQKEENESEQNKSNDILVSNFPILHITEIRIQQDLSSLSYPYALSLIHNSTPPTIPPLTTQGDTKFYEYCNKLRQKTIPQILNFSECTDTFMTMLIILATNLNNRFEIPHKSIKIVGIANQRVKQSNRIQMVVKNLKKVCDKVREIQDGVQIWVDGWNIEGVGQGEVVFQTAGDHRLAMSMAVLATYLNQQPSIQSKGTKFIIDNKQCVNKTFPKFWQYLSESGISLTPVLPPTTSPSLPHISPLKTSPISRLLLMGNRGCGKTTIARMLCQKDKIKNKQYTLIDIDQEITKRIQEEYPGLKSISDLVESRGWDQFRRLENREVEKYAYSGYLENGNIGGKKNVIISLGGGVVDWPASLSTLSKKSQPSFKKIYIQKNFSDLQITLNDKRPYIENFQKISKSREKKYTEISDYIITIPSIYKHSTISDNQQKGDYHYRKINQYIISQIQRLDYPGNILQQGYICCIPHVYENSRVVQLLNQQEFGVRDGNGDGNGNGNGNGNQAEVGERLSGVQLRVDSIGEQLLANCEIGVDWEKELMKKIRFAVAQFKFKNYPILKGLPIILTLRTKDEFGKFPFTVSDKAAANSMPYTNSKYGYREWLKWICQIPGDYTDVQTKLFPQTCLSNNRKYIFSYHGNNQTDISTLLSLSTPTNSHHNILKLCYSGQQKTFKKYHKTWQKNTQICINLNNPLTRIQKQNKYRMFIRQNDKSGIIDIPTRKMLGMLGKVSRYFRL